MTTETTDHYSSSTKHQYFELSDDSDGEYEAFRRALHRYRRRLLVGREKKQEYQQDHSLKDDDSTDTKVELRGTIIKSARTDTKVELRGTIIKSARSTTAPSFITNQNFLLFVSSIIVIVYLKFMLQQYLYPQFQPLRKSNQNLHLKQQQSLELPEWAVDLADLYETPNDLDVPFLWHVPGASDYVADYLRECHDSGGDNKGGSNDVFPFEENVPDGKLDVSNVATTITTINHNFDNFDIIRISDHPPAITLIVTTRPNEISKLFTQHQQKNNGFVSKLARRGRMIAILRHPLDLVKLEYLSLLKQWNYSVSTPLQFQPSSPPPQPPTLVEYVTDPRRIDNPITRILCGLPVNHLYNDDVSNGNNNLLRMIVSLNDEHYRMAINVLTTKCLVGLYGSKRGSKVFEDVVLNRIRQYLMRGHVNIKGTEEVEFERRKKYETLLDCRQKVLKRHLDLDVENEEEIRSLMMKKEGELTQDKVNTILKRDHMDLALFEFAKSIFDEQKAIFI